MDFYSFFMQEEQMETENVDNVLSTEVRNELIKEFNNRDIDDIDYIFYTGIRCNSNNIHSLEEFLLIMVERFPLETELPIIVFMAGAQIILKQPSLEIKIKKELISRVTEFVITEDNEEYMLYGLEKDCSHEGGFTLPWTTEWRSKTFNNRDIALRYHNSRQLRFVHNSEGDVISLRFKDNCNYWSVGEIAMLKDLINISLNKLKSREFFLDYPLVINDDYISDEEFQNNLDNITNLIPTDAIIGDIIQTIPHNIRYRNSGTLIITADGVKLLCDKYDEYGSIYPSLKVAQGSFNPTYWKSSICHNNIIFLSDEIKNQFVSNWDLVKNCSLVIINSKTYNCVIVNENDENINISPEIINLLKDEETHFELTDDTAFSDGRDFDGLFIMLRVSNIIN